MLYFILICSVSLINPFFGLIFGGVMQFISKKYNLLYTLLFVIVLAIPALFFIPDVTMDASRYFYAMKIFNPYNTFKNLWLFISGNFGTYVQYKAYPLSIWIMYVISKTSRYTLLSFITVLIGYFCTLRPFVDHFWRENKNEENRNRDRWFTIFAFLVVFFLNHYLFYMSVFRYYLGVSLFILVLYYDDIAKKKIYLLWYIPIILIHPGILFFVVCRFLVPLFKKISLVKIMLIIFSGSILLTIGNYIDKLNVSYLSYIYTKFKSYATQGGVLETVTTNSKIIEIIQVVSILVYLFIFLLEYLHFNNKKPFQKPLYVTTLLLAIFVLAFIPYNDMFIRYGGVIVILMLIFYVREFSRFNNIEKIVVITNLCALMILGGWINKDIIGVNFGASPLSYLFISVFEIIQRIPIY